MVARNPEPVNIGNPGFFVVNVMKDCPAKTVIRELLQNAIEAAGTGQIEFFIDQWHGVPKLGLYNEGPGMDVHELNVLMDIASSGKALGFDKNFGQGAKMSAGKASPYGLVYRSCKHGLVYQIWLQVIEEDDGNKRLVKVPQYDPYDEEEVIVTQVTDEALERGRTLDHDWTEAILLGRSADDNTLTGDFIGERSAMWLSAIIAQRYYHFPEGVSIENVSVTSTRDPERRKAAGLADLVSTDRYGEQQETVEAEDSYFGKLQLVYGRLKGNAKARRSGPWYAYGIPGGTHVCLVYKDEVYSLDHKWAFRAGAYGFSGISQDYYVHVLLPDDANLMNNNHRTEILTNDDRAEPLKCDDFSALIRQHRPQWILDDIKNRVETNTSGTVHERLQKIAAQLQSHVGEMPVTPDLGQDLGLIEMDKGDGPGGRGRTRGSTEQPGGRWTRPGIGKKTNRPRADTLQVYFMSEDHQASIEHHGRAGYYDETANRFWLNREFSEYVRLKTWVDQEWPEMEDHAMACPILDEEYCVFAGAYAIGALSFRGQDHWTPDEWKKGLTPEAIACHMRDPLKVMQRAIHIRVARKLNTAIRDR